jgi:hypothetical protein
MVERREHTVDRGGGCATLERAKEASREYGARMGSRCFGGDPKVEK